MYGFSVSLHLSFETTLDKVTEALKAEGFGVLTDIDVKATLKVKLNAEIPNYRILGACNPALAYRAIEANPEIGLFLPCSVVVREGPGTVVTVSFRDPVAVLERVDNEDVRIVGQEVRAKLERVRDRLIEQAST